MKTFQYSPIRTAQSNAWLFVSVILLAMLLASFKLSAQTSYQSIPAVSNVKVLGSSNLHDWTMSDEHITSGAAFTFQDGKLNDVTALNFSMKVKELKSSEDLLNSRAYKAMNADQYPAITFKMTAASATPLANGHYTIKASGKLQIGAVTKDVVLYANAVQNADKTISCSGSEKLKMSDYGIAPPSFMFGALKVVDDVTIQFNLKFKN